MTDALNKVIAGANPVFLLIAGPNGASKSTYTQKRIRPLGFPCIDPDAIGLELFGRHPSTRDEARQGTLEATRRTRASIQQRRSIALETVFSDTKGHKVGLLREATDAGFKTVLIFIGVDSPEICIARVLDRVQHGGHDVPDDIIRDRFPKCFNNLKTALPSVDLTILIDNSGCYDTDGKSPDGRRHYEFAHIEAGSLIHLSTPTPRWFTEFGIVDCIRPRVG